MQMKTKFMMSGSSVHLFRMNNETALDILPARVYTIRFSKMEGYYLDITKDLLEVPNKIYGKTLARVDKCIRTYKDRKTSTGILMTGDKGTGKTLLMSLLCNAAIAELSLPVILVRDAYHDDNFITFVESIGECALVFDEFGKMYTSGMASETEVSQKSLLSLMDGVDKTKRLIILTENKELDINEFMLNRPSRIYYHFRYNKLDEDSTRGYCEDHGVSTESIAAIIELSRHSMAFSFDMLQSIVEEHIRFDAPIDEITCDLNIDLRKQQNSTIEIVKIIEKSSGKIRELFGSAFVPKPSRYTEIKIKRDSPKKRGSEFLEMDADDDGAEYEEFYLESKHLAYESKGQIVYETDAYTVVAKEVVLPFTNYMSYLA